MTQYTDQLISAREANRAVLHTMYWRSSSKREFIETLYRDTNMSVEQLDMAWEGIDLMVDCYEIENPLDVEEFERPESHRKIGLLLNSMLDKSRESQKEVKAEEESLKAYISQTQDDDLAYLAEYLGLTVAGARP